MLINLERFRAFQPLGGSEVHLEACLFTAVCLPVTLLTLHARVIELNLFQPGLMQVNVTKGPGNVLHPVFYLDSLLHSATNIHITLHYVWRKDRISDIYKHRPTNTRVIVSLAMQSSPKYNNAPNKYFYCNIFISRNGQTNTDDPQRA